MKNADYEIIIKNIVDQISACESALSQYHTCSRDLNKMTMEHINLTITSCRKVASAMDKFARDDLYHIVGMADLSAAQMSKVLKLTKELMKYRSDIKFFSIQNTIPIPTRNSKSSYKLASGIELTKEFNYE